MKLKSFIPLALLALAAAAVVQAQQRQPQTAGAGGGGARSDSPGGGGGGDVRVAMANPSRIFREMQETKDLQESLRSEGVKLTAEEKEKRAELQTLQNKRNQLKPDTPQWDEFNTDLMDAALEFRLWGEQTKAKAARTQKRQMKHLFEQIEQAIAEVAERDGYDLVVADQRPELPENLDEINFDQLRALINSRNVLYASAKADISDQVIAMLDARYKSRGGAGANGAATPAAAGGARRATPRQGGGTGGGGGAPAGNNNAGQQ